MPNRRKQPFFMTAEFGDIKVYTVNGAAAGSSSSLPDWLTRKRVAKKGKRAIREHYEGNVELLQQFEFSEASNRVRTTRDGHHVIATGTYKPQMRVWDLDRLALKFERHSDAENVDFIVRELFRLTSAYQVVMHCGLDSFRRLDKIRTLTK
jgi:ribosome biogenesis protein ENP2